MTKRIELWSLGQPVLYIERAIELSACALVGHVTNLSEDWSFRAPGSIVFASDGPRDPCIAVGVPSIEFVPVV